MPTTHEYFRDDYGMLFYKKSCGCIFEYWNLEDSWELILPCSDSHIWSK